MSVPRRTRARNSFWPIVLVSALLGLAPVRGASARPAAKAAPAAARETPTPTIAPAEPSRARQVIDALKASRAELTSQRQKLASVAAEQRAGLLLQLVESGSRHRQLLNQTVSALHAAEPLPGSVEERNELLALLGAELSVESEKLPGEVSDVSQNALAAIDALPSAKPEQRPDLLTRRDRSIELIPGLLNEIQKNINARTSLKQDTGAEQTRFKELLGDRAKWLSGALRSSASEISRIKLDAYGKPSADEQARYNALVDFRSLLAEAQRKTVSLMDQNGLETVQLRQELISTTGQMSKDILDAQVMKGLVSGWNSDLRRWVSEHAPSIAFRLLSLVVVLLLFGVLARMGRSLVRRALARGKANPSSLASDFLIKTTGRAIWLVGFVIAAAQLGIEVGPLLAGLGIAGFVAGFALQDALSNFAAGLLILLYRPFDVGDLIEAGGVSGVVRTMTLVSTSVLTLDNQLLIVPNGKIWGGVIRNVTSQEQRRVDLTFSVSYRDDISHAESVLSAIIADNARVLSEPPPIVRLHELGEGSVKFVVRPWVKSADYWDAYWEITREVKRRFDAEGFAHPFPQQDVHLYEERRFDGAPRESQPAPAFAVGS